MDFAGPQIRAIKSRRNVVRASQAAKAPAAPRRREAAPMAMATALHANISRAKLSAREKIRVGGGQGTSRGPNALRPNHVAVIIEATTAEMLTAATMIERVMIQCRAIGRDRTKSIKPDSISNVGMVAMAIASARREAMTMG